MKQRIDSVKPNFDYNTDSMLSVVNNLPCVMLSPTGPWLAGGSVLRWFTDEPQSGDFDFYFANQAQYNQFSDNMKYAASRIHSSAYARSYQIAVDGEKVIVQAVHAQFFPTLESVLLSFDLTICQLGFDGQDIEFGPTTKDDIAKRQLVPHNITNSANTIQRLAKYSARGYELTLQDATDTVRKIIRLGDKGLASFVRSDVTSKFKTNVGNTDISADEFF